jgi:AraC family transcriptional regulator
MNTVVQSDTGRVSKESGRRLAIGSWSVELLPRHAYEVMYTPDEAVVGFAFESQIGSHAFSSDRVRPFFSKPNSLAYVPIGCAVFSSSQEGGEYLRVTKADEFIGEVPAQRQFNDFIDPIAISAAQTIRNLLLTNSPAPLLLEEKLIILAERVKCALKGNLVESRQGRSMTPARLRRIDELIDATINQDVTIKVMADALGLSEAFFIRAFKAAVGKSPHSYLIDRRLAKARKLLKTSHHDLREIALAVGFSSHAHMTAAFRTRLGITPSTLRRD